jgi:hypothetical protein
MSTINPNTLSGLVATFTEEYSKFSGGNNSAGTRARKALQEIIKFSRLHSLEALKAKCVDFLHCHGRCCWGPSQQGLINGQSATVFRQVNSQKFHRNQTFIVLKHLEVPQP